MRHKVILMALFITILNILPLMGEEISPKDFYGEWIVSRHIPTSGVSAITYDEAKEYEGEIVVYNDNLVKFGKKQCSQPQYNIRKNNKTTFETETYNNFSELEIKGKLLYEVTIKCGAEIPRHLYASHFFFENKNRLLFLIKGVWFELIRKK